MRVTYSRPLSQYFGIDDSCSICNKAIDATILKNSVITTAVVLIYRGPETCASDLHNRMYEVPSDRAEKHRLIFPSRQSKI